VDPDCRELRRGPQGNKPHSGHVDHLVMPRDGQVCVKAPTFHSLGTGVIAAALSMAGFCHEGLAWRLSCPCCEGHLVQFIAPLKRSSELGCAGM